jgi:hypothetical protein
MFSQDFGRAAEMFRGAAQAGLPEAQYALATLYKEGRGVAKDPQETAKWMGSASQAGNLDAMVEYAIALYNGTGVPKDQTAAVTLLTKAARRGSAIAQNRLAHVLASGEGATPNPTEAIKWHLVSKAGGNSDPYLDDFAGHQTPEVRAAAEAASKPWIAAFTGKRS